MHLIIISFIIQTCTIIILEDLMMHLIGHSLDVRASSIKICGAQIWNSIDASFQIQHVSISYNINLNYIYLEDILNFH